MLWTSGTFARELERSVETIRNWEKRGILKSTRDASGRRLFTSEDLERMRELERTRRGRKKLVAR